MAKIKNSILGTYPCQLAETAHPSFQTCQGSSTCTIGDQALWHYWPALRWSIFGSCLTGLMGLKKCGSTHRLEVHPSVFQQTPVFGRVRLKANYQRKIKAWLLLSILCAKRRSISLGRGLLNKTRPLAHHRWTCPHLISAGSRSLFWGFPHPRSLSSWTCSLQIWTI